MEMMSTIKNVAIAAVIVGGICFLYLNRKRLVRRLSSIKGKNAGKASRNHHDAMSDVYSAFLVYADVFQGLYEPMYKASKGLVSRDRIQNVLSEWNIRMDGIPNIPIGLKGWWFTIVANQETLSYTGLQQQSQKVMQMIENCGIIRDDQSDLVAENDTSLYYQHIDGVVFEVGQKLQVESPCWYMQTSPVRIIEKGYCVIV